MPDPSTSIRTRTTLALLTVAALLGVPGPEVRAADDWSTAPGPLEGPPRIIGKHGAACLIGAEQLPLEGIGYQTADLARRRHFGHPVLIDYIEDLGRRVANAEFGPMLVGDMAQPRGGPMSYGHVSHQSGLDVDIWFRLDLPPLDRSEREGLEQPILVDPMTGQLDRARWTEDHAKLIQLAADDPRVARIFVDAAVKEDLCSREWEDRSWLRHIRPWPAHDEHLHVRLRCPENSPECVDQPEPPPGEGCQGLVPTPRTERESLPIRTLPQACRAVLSR
ncbi:MAG TPA: penicillin-insensitive murein endopeptidase [Pseudomonas xinjiangensis]|uniref:Penicillin-insensitive murein endopeptidase n=2 Tax=root TaxID=1 RepID=A0A7V1BS50_9GAMM|nr:penicillin-insensitive murein endopeptidase [Halopseudomonas xinjiangensis]HEC46989.1 penicillin-insensitive murein endopeptidase [Halopseudomonas xinjiangensis]